MVALNVYIEINGSQERVGSLTGNDYSDTRFSYDDTYMTSDHGRPISVSLPLQKTPFSAAETRSFFEALLPEGFSRKTAAEWAKADENDYVTLLKHLGKECIGAIQITEGERPSDGGYEPVSEKELILLAGEGAAKSTEMLIESHISLAGASGKVGLYYDGEEERWYRPYGIAASTHIVKQSHVRLKHLVLNEQLCMRAASRLNIDVPESFIINVGKGGDADILYATKRFDRIPNPDRTGPRSPCRLHQEDFGQALGIPGSEKYETENKDYLKRIFGLINDYSSDPIEDGLKLWDRIVFNYLIGNTDAHIKNFALIYDKDLRKIRLAPAYDIVCTRIYGKRNEMSMMINGKLDCTALTRDDFVSAARRISIGPKLAMKHFDYISGSLEEALRSSAEELANSGFTYAYELCDDIISKSKELQI